MRYMEATNDTAMNEERNQMALDAGGVCIWDWDLLNDTFYRSPKYCLLAGCFPGEGTSNFSLFKATIHPEDIGLCMSHIEAHTQGKTSVAEFEYRLANQSNGIKWVRMRGRIVGHNGAGQPIRMVGTLVDVTHCKLAEADNKLRTSLLNAAGQAVISTDLEGSITYLNRAAELLYGWPVVEATGRNILEVMPFLMRDGFHGNNKDSLSRGRDWAGELTVRHRNGERFMAEVHQSPLYDQHGKLTGIVHVSSDLTERRRIDQQYQLVIDAAPNAMIMANEQGVIKLANVESTILFGYTTEELVGQSIDMLLPVEARHSHPEKLKNYISDAPVQRKLGNGRELFGIHRNGRKIPIEIGLSPLKMGNEFFAIATIIDVTERKRREAEAARMQEQMLQASKMESIGHLTAGVAHDFNNILAAIMGFTELARHMLVTGKHTEIDRYLNEILKAGNRAKDLILQMLAFCGMSFHDKSRDAPVIILTDTIRDILTMLRASIPKTIELNFNIEVENLQARIHPAHLHQILFNLCLNARDSISKYGTIDLSLTLKHADKLTCSSCKAPFSADYACISVRDSGCGVAETIVKIMFEPFVTSKEVGKGTGLGLSVVHGLVHSQGGHIHVDTSTTGGSVFNIMLPLVTLETSHES